MSTPKILGTFGETLKIPNKFYLTKRVIKQFFKLKFRHSCKKKHI